MAGVLSLLFMASVYGIEFQFEGVRQARVFHCCLWADPKLCIFRVMHSYLRQTFPHTCFRMAKFEVTWVECFSICIHVSRWKIRCLPEEKESVFDPCFRRKIRCLPGWKIEAAFSYYVVSGRVRQLWLRPTNLFTYMFPNGRVQSYLNVMIQYLHTFFQMKDTLLTSRVRFNICTHVSEGRYVVYLNERFRQ